MNTLNTELIEGQSVEQLVDEYEAAELNIRSGFKLVDDALTRLRNITGAPGVSLTSRSGRGRDDTDFDKPDFYLRELRRDTWRVLIARMEVRRAMSMSAWSKLEAEIEQGEPPPITIENVEGMISEFRARIPDMLKEAIKEVFEWLRPRCSEYKTNSEFEIGERVILGWMVECQSYSSYWNVNYSHEQNLFALENVFNLVQGKPAPEVNGWSELAQAIKRIPSNQPCHGATPLFEFRGHKNRNLHIKFRRMDLVAKLNAIAGGNRLKPDPRAPVTKPEEDPTYELRSAESKLETLAEEFRHGARTTAVQFFPTPDPVASQLAAELDVQNGDRVLEPSAGTGQLLKAIYAASEGKVLGEVVAVEIDDAMAAEIADAWNIEVRCSDFMQFGGRFDRIAMNPPFANGAAMAHIWHAIGMLAPGGRLVAVCPDGPRENDLLRPVIEARGGTWESLPEGSFESSGTGVRTALIVVDAPEPATRTEAA
jgi:protein-L-isoaspartate O-methyltransferase